MLLLKEDYDNITQAIALLQKVCKNLVMSELEEAHERDFKNINLGLVNLRKKSLIEVIKEMLINLHIKGSTRVRKNGLIEVRTQQFGSVYGRDVEEIEFKFQQKLNEIKAAGKQVSKQKHTVVTLSEFFETVYLPYKKNQKRKENTINGIIYNFSYIVKQGFDKPMNAYTPQKIEEFLFSIQLTRKRQLMQGLLNNIFKRAVLSSVIKTNPCAVIERMIHKSVRGTALTLKEQAEYFKLVFSSKNLSHSLKCYFAFVYLTGTRRTEALAANVNDIDGDTLKINGTKTDGSLRYIPLTPLVKKLLDSVEPVKGKYFPYAGKTVDEIFYENNKLLKFKHKLHDLRHTFGTIQICVRKIDVKTVSLWLGHSTIETTLRIYTHPEQLDRATFLSGTLQENEKNAILLSQYQRVIYIIEDYLSSYTQNLPKKS